jgi:Ca-activated chloride channel homolog
VNALSFGAPLILASLLILLPAAWWSVSRDQRRRRAELAAFGDESLLAQSSALPSAGRHRANQVLRVVAVLLGVVALARPQLGTRPATLARTGRDLLVLLDLSRSMNAADAGPTGSQGGTRLATAKQAITTVVARSPGDRLGLIVFGGSAFLQLPLTADHAAFQRFLDAASPDDLGDPATNLTNALTVAATTFEHEGERGYQSVLLASDGESGEGDPGPVLARLRRSGIPVFAMGIGTPSGAPVPADSDEAPEKWHRDHIGRVVLSRLEEGDLRRAARETNGVYARWMGDAGSLEIELGRLDKRTLVSAESVERVDRFQWPLGLAMLALAWELSIRTTLHRRRL